MKIFFLILAVSSSFILSNCSCAIYHEEYKVNPLVFKEDFALAKKAVKGAGFHIGTSTAQRFFAGKDDLSLMIGDSYDEGISSNVRLYSSFCPFIPFKMDWKSWEAECKVNSKDLLDQFDALGYPLTPNPPSRRHTNFGEQDAAPNR